MINRATCVFITLGMSHYEESMFENNTLCQLICSLLPNSLPPIGRNQCICEIAFLNLTTKNNLALITENEFIIQIEISPQILNQVQKRP